VKYDQALVTLLDTIRAGLTDEFKSSWDQRGTPINHALRLVDKLQVEKGNLADDITSYKVLRTCLPLMKGRSHSSVIRQRRKQFHALAEKLANFYVDDLRGH